MVERLKSLFRLILPFFMRSWPNWTRHNTTNVEIGGSNPFGRTKFRTETPVQIRTIG